MSTVIAIFNNYFVLVVSPVVGIVLASNTCTCQLVNLYPSQREPTRERRFVSVEYLSPHVHCTINYLMLTCVQACTIVHMYVCKLTLVGQLLCLHVNLHAPICRGRGSCFNLCSFVTRLVTGLTNYYRSV